MLPLGSDAVGRDGRRVRRSRLRCRASRRHARRGLAGRIMYRCTCRPAVGAGPHQRRTRGRSQTDGPLASAVPRGRIAWRPPGPPKHIARRPACTLSRGSGLPCATPAERYAGGNAVEMPPAPPPRRAKDKVGGARWAGIGRLRGCPSHSQEGVVTTQGSGGCRRVTLIAPTRRSPCHEWPSTRKTPFLARVRTSRCGEHNRNGAEHSKAFQGLVNHWLQKGPLSARPPLLTTPFPLILETSSLSALGALGALSRTSGSSGVCGSPNWRPMVSNGGPFDSSWVLRACDGGGRLWQRASVFWKSAESSLATFVAPLEVRLEPRGCARMCMFDAYCTDASGFVRNHSGFTTAVRSFPPSRMGRISRCPIAIRSHVSFVP